MEAVQIGRYDRVFDVYADADDCVTRASFSAYIIALADASGVAHDAPAVVALEEEASLRWELIAGLADADRNGRITRSEWRAVAETLSTQMQAMIAQGGPNPFDSFVAGIYGVMDSDGDGRLTREEYDRWVEVTRRRTDIQSRFDTFDLDQDGHLSIGEFTNLFHQFWTEFDEQVTAEGWIGK